MHFVSPLAPIPLTMAFLRLVRRPAASGKEAKESKESKDASNKRDVPKKVIIHLNLIGLRFYPI
jgi:hypothetical protein